jgi:hypothetical protein
MDGLGKVVAGVLAVLVLILIPISCRIGGVGGKPEVRVIYLVPADKEEMPQAKAGSLNALKHLQRWYYDQVGTGMTFSVAADHSFRVVKTKHPEDWYRKHPNGDNPEFFWFQNAIDDAGWAAGIGSDLIVVLLDADIEGHGAGAAAHRSGRFAVMPWRYARAFAGQNIEPPCHAVGVLGHELGHIFGLDHPENCVSHGYRTMVKTCDSIMYFGPQDYPRTFLSEDHKTKVRNHPAFQKQEPPAGSDFDCDRLLISSGNTGSIKQASAQRSRNIIELLFQR